MSRAGTVGMSLARLFVSFVLATLVYVVVLVGGLYLLGLRVTFLVGPEPTWLAWLGLVAAISLASMTEKLAGSKLRPWARRRRVALEFVGGPLDGRIARAFIDAAGSTPVLESDEFDGPTGTFRYRLAYVGEREVLQYVGPA